jgi:hypothetical protein
MKIVGVEKAEFIGKDLAITWLDTNHSKRKDLLSPNAQGAALMSLLPPHPARLDDPVRGPFLADNLQLVNTRQGLLVLQVLVGTPSRVIQIALPQHLVGFVREKLAEDPNTWPGGATTQ